MDREELTKSIRERARKNFSLGYNCAECITEAVFSLVDTGMPVDAKKCATGFGGGIGLFGDTCGALVGAVMAVSAVYGRTELPPGEDPKTVAKRSREQLYGRPGIYRIFNQVPNRFKEQFGHTLCRELAGKWQTEWLCRDHALHCREIITEAAGIAADLILSDREALAALDFGDNVENLKD